VIDKLQTQADSRQQGPSDYRAQFGRTGIELMSKKHYFDDQYDVDESTYSLLGSRFGHIEEDLKNKLQRKWRDRSDDSNNRRSARRPKRDRERLN